MVDPYTINTVATVLMLVVVVVIVYTRMRDLDAGAKNRRILEIGNHYVAEIKGTEDNFFSCLKCGEHRRDEKKFRNLNCSQDYQPNTGESSGESAN